MKVIYLSWLLFMACSIPGENDHRQANTTNIRVNVEIHLEEKHQTIAHFGASDAWSCQFVGTWPDDKKNRIADLLFSKEISEEGQPEGIGLSLWRFNLGAGSAAQGEQSGIRDPWRRASSVMDENGDFDANRQKGQLWFAQAAKDREVEHLLVFLNSPPVWLTRNGKAYTDSGQRSNLDPSNYEAFGEYMAKAIAGLENTGLSVDYISPVNEPQWDWEDGGQEGTPFWNEEIAGIANALNLSLEKRGDNTNIDLAEAGQIEYLYEEHNRPGRSEQINAFFNPESELYLGDLSRVSNSISGHSYFTTSPLSMAVTKREQLANSLASFPGLTYWMSEYCILGDNDGEIEGRGRDLGMTPALYMARVIHTDLTTSGASAWHWWLGVSPYNYKDGLVYVDKEEEDGEIYESKMLWTLGNFSRFIRPGYHRIGVNAAVENAEKADVLVSGYKDPDSRELVLVLVNSSIHAATVSIPEELGEDYGWSAFLTDEDNDLSPILVETGTETITLPERSVMTLVGKD
ncbi:glycoside hydrolase [Pleomorphovibrio marinus]|uniref:glycoside hydrolase n=1 Tax=Pleomorphovibrio marinus TaxID=2164132 RepID=UPI000E0C5F18|nr:glycoside hydrolase [Pleomorphovibrio marinus]